VTAEARHDQEAERGASSCLSCWLYAASSSLTAMTASRHNNHGQFVEHKAAIVALTEQNGS
jgi:hypothetical protein